MTDSDAQTKFIAGVPLIIITGLSGAGKSTAMRFLEDLGCYCLDNLPPGLVLSFFNLYEQSGASGPGVVIASDVRSGALFDDFSDMVKTLNASKMGCEILYLDCATETLVSRFKEVRRNHPLQPEHSIEQAIEEERRRLEPIRAIATRIIDTSGLEPSQLRETIIHSLMDEETAHVVTLEFLSFGFKYGVPRDVDFVFDARFLPNPYYVEALRPLTGKDDLVDAFVMSGPLANTYFEKIVSILEMTLESFVKVGKTTLTVGVGCTGGRHRSVSIACRLARRFEGNGGQSRVIHRDLSKLQG